MNTPRLIFFVTAITVILLLLGIKFIEDKYNSVYVIEITFCDGRKPILSTYEGLEAPSNQMIDTYKEAVPKFQGYLNVCNIKTIEEITYKN